MSFAAEGASRSLLFHPKKFEKKSPFFLKFSLAIVSDSAWINRCSVNIRLNDWENVKWTKFFFRQKKPKILRNELSPNSSPNKSADRAVANFDGKNVLSIVSRPKKNDLHQVWIFFRKIRVGVVLQAPSSLSVCYNLSFSLSPATSSSLPGRRRLAPSPTSLILFPLLLACNSSWKFPWRFPVPKSAAAHSLPAARAGHWSILLFWGLHFIIW